MIRPGPVRLSRPIPPRAGQRRAAPGPPNATVREATRHGRSIVELVVEPDDRPDPFEAGQYLSLGIEVEGRLVQRPYSIASSPGEPYRFAIRLVPEGLLTPRLWALVPGDRLRLGRPRGLFRLVEGCRARLLLGTGTGIAPLVAMALALDSDPGVPAIVLHGVRSADELVFSERLRRWSARGPGRRYVPAISRPGEAGHSGWTGEVGRLDAIAGRVAAEAGIDVPAAVAYLCGSRPAVDAIAGALLAAGMPAAAVHREAFDS